MSSNLVEKRHAEKRERVRLRLQTLGSMAADFSVLQA